MEDRTPLLLVVMGLMFLAFAVYHYFSAKSWLKSAEADDTKLGSGASKSLSAMHYLRGIGSLVAGIALVVGGIILLAA